MRVALFQSVNLSQCEEIPQWILGNSDPSVRYVLPCIEINCLIMVLIARVVDQELTL